MATHPIESLLFLPFNESHRFRSTSFLVAALVSPPMEDTLSTLKSNVTARENKTPLRAGSALETPGLTCHAFHVLRCS